MNFHTILLVAGALGTDAFSLAIGMGLGKGTLRRVYLFPLIVAVFHVIMPLIGLGAGIVLGKVLGQVARYIGGTVLILIGLHMFQEAREKKTGCSVPGTFRGKIFTGFWAMMLVAGSVSLDALTAGLSLGALQVNLWLTVITFGLVAGLMTLAGLLCGQKLGCWLGEKAQLVGGLVLVVIGVTMFF